MSDRLLIAAAALIVGLVGWRAKGLFHVSQPQAAPKANLPSPWPPAIGQPYPDLQLLDQDGHEVALSSFKGRLIVLEPVGMTCAACNAFSGANKPDIGPFEGQSAQQDLTSAEEFFPQYAGGVQLDDDRLVYIQLLLYNSRNQTPTLDDARRWASHFRFTAKNHYVLIPKTDMTGPASYGLIPGLQLIDKDFILRDDATGDNPKEDLYTQALPDVPRLL